MINKISHSFNIIIHLFGLKSPFQEMKKNYSDLKILNISGSLCECENNQRLYLIVNQSIIDYKFGNITLRNQ